MGDSAHTPLSSEETLGGLSDSSRLFLRWGFSFELNLLKNLLTDWPMAAIGLRGGEVATGGGDRAGTWQVCRILDQWASSATGETIR